MLVLILFIRYNFNGFYKIFLDITKAYNPRIWQLCMFTEILNLYVYIHKYVGLLVKIFTVFIITNHVSIHLAYQVIFFFNHFFYYLKNWCHYLLHFFTGVVLLNFFLLNCLHISVHFFVLFWCRKIKPIEDQMFVPDTWIHVYWKL